MGGDVQHFHAKRARDYARHKQSDKWVVTSSTSTRNAITDSTQFPIAGFVGSEKPNPSVII